MTWVLVCIIFDNNVDQVSPPLHLATEKLNIGHTFARICWQGSFSPHCLQPLSNESLRRGAESEPSESSQLFGSTVCMLEWLQQWLVILTHGVKFFQRWSEFSILTVAVWPIDDYYADVQHSVSHLFPLHDHEYLRKKKKKTMIHSAGSWNLCYKSGSPMRR